MRESTLDARGAQLRQQRGEIINAKVDHERLRSGREAGGVGRKRRPQDIAEALRVLVETHAAPLVYVETELLSRTTRQVRWNRVV